MGIGRSKPKQTNCYKLTKQIQDLTRQLSDNEENIENRNQTIKLQTESLKIRDQDIRNLQEALKERDHILRGVKWALSLQTAEPWSPKPAIRSKHTVLTYGMLHTKGSQQVNEPGVSEPSSDNDRPTVPFENERKISNDKTFC